MERGYQTHSLFTGMGVPPPEVTAKKANLPRLKWRPSKKAGWATELLPEASRSVACCLVGWSRGADPTPDEERRCRLERTASQAGAAPLSLMSSMASRRSMHQSMMSGYGHNQHATIYHGHDDEGVDERRFGEQVSSWCREHTVHPT